MSEFDIRFSEETDLAHLERWFADPAACDDFPFGFEERADALKNWIGFSRYRASLTGIMGETVAAIGTLFLMPYKKVSHHCSFYLFVDPLYRRQGIGTAMVRNLVHLAKTRFRLEMVHVEIYGGNPLQSVLEQVGFIPFVRQENFVKIDGCPRPRVLLEHSNV